MLIFCVLMMVVGNKPRPKKSSAPGDCKKSNVIQSSINTTGFIVLQSQSSLSHVILPTFTSRINKFSGKGQKCSVTRQVNPLSSLKNV